MTVDVILPCLDEAAALPWVLTRVPRGFRAIVVDNGSHDESVEIARGHGAVVVTAQQRGYGAACHAGLLAASSELVCLMDADASLDPRDLPRIVAPLVAGRADLVIGRRRTRSLRAWPLSSRIANAALAAIVRRRIDFPLRDLGPMRAARRQDLLALDLTDRRFGYPLQTLLAADGAQWRLAEVPISYRPRTGRSKVTGTPGGYLRAVQDMRAVLAQ